MPKRRSFLAAIPAATLAAQESGTADHKGTIYIPPRHLEADEEYIRAFVREYSFAMIVTSHGGTRITNVPTLLEAPTALAPHGTVVWHISKANEQNGALQRAGAECTVVFHGPHGYISPNWYQTPNAVPTWNFATVHASGTPMKVDSDDEFAEILSRLVAENEAHYGGGERWRYEKLPAAYLKGMRQGIVAYRMPIAKFEAKFKLGQERSEADRAGVLAALGEQPAPRGLHAFTEQHYKRMKP